MALHLIEIPEDEREAAARLAEALTQPWSGLTFLVGGEPTHVNVPPALAALIADAMRELSEHGKVVMSTEPADPAPGP